MAYFLIKPSLWEANVLYGGLVAHILNELLHCIVAKDILGKYDFLDSDLIFVSLDYLREVSKAPTWYVVLLEIQTL